ncbi:hypothetical protein BJY52DRAFT_1284665 [Lactarius psammicola]|nr:hypothetical protein BJY52DRAFT_1284665 [Lactarius psammicola]
MSSECPILWQIFLIFFFLPESGQFPAIVASQIHAALLGPCVPRGRTGCFRPRPLAWNYTTGRTTRQPLGVLYKFEGAAKLWTSIAPVPEASKVFSKAGTACGGTYARELEPGPCRRHAELCSNPSTRDPRASKVDDLLPAVHARAPFTIVERILISIVYVYVDRLISGGARCLASAPACDAIVPERSSSDLRMSRPDGSRLSLTSVSR